MTKITNKTVIKPNHQLIITIPFELNFFKTDTYRKMIQKDNHSLFVFEYEWVDNLHVGLLAAKLDEVGEVLQALGYHD